MTNREQAIRDVAEHLGIRVADLKIDLEYPGHYPRTAYAVSQRERVLELEAELACKASTRSPRGFQEALEQAQLQQKEGERG